MECNNNETLTCKCIPTLGGATYSGASSYVRLFVTSLMTHPPAVQATIR